MCSVQQNNDSIITATATSLYSIHQQRKSLRSIVFAWYCHWIARHLNYFFSISSHSSSEFVFTFWMFFVSFEHSMALLTFIFIWWIGIVITLIQEFTHTHTPNIKNWNQFTAARNACILSNRCCCDVFLCFDSILISFWFSISLRFIRRYLLLNIYNCVQTLIYCNTNTHTVFNCCHRYTSDSPMNHDTVQYFVCLLMMMMSLIFFYSFSRRWNPLWCIRKVLLVEVDWGRWCISHKLYSYIYVLCVR